MGRKQSAGSTGAYSTHLIDGQGNFNRSGLESFTEKAKLSQSGQSYTVISIMGPQSSGKSTLLNHMFQTTFTEMNANKGRSQTTLGGWLAKCVNIEPCTLVLDLEGNDGRERGENDTSFEKQLALFALAVSDIVLINMWCHDVGREKAANKPLLRTTFQVMMRLFKPRQTTLLFVLRDKTQTPFSKLEEILKKDTLEIWDSIPKPQSHKDTEFSEFFNLKVVALSSYEEEMEEYMEEVIELRERLSSGEMSSTEGAGVVPALGFSISAENIWNTIRDNKDLNIPPPSVMIAKVRCEEIAREKLEAFLANDEWSELSEAMSSNPVPDFGNKTSSLIDACLEEYDEDAQLYEDTIREERREMLLENLLLRIKPVYDSALQAIMTEKVRQFKDAFHNDLKESGGESFRDVVESCTERYSTQFEEAIEDIMIPQAANNWESSISDKEKFVNEMNEIVGQSRRGKLNDLIHEYKERLREGADEPLDMILGNPGSQTWPNIRQLLEEHSRDIGNEYYQAISELGSEEENSDQIQTQFQGYLKEIIASKAKTETMKLTTLMQDRFTTLFLQDSNSMPRAWDEDDVDIKKIIRVAKTECLKILSAMVAIRLEGDDDDDIEDTLKRALMGGGDDEDDRPSYGALAMTTWSGISKEDTLITPIRCASIWKQFLAKTNQITTLVDKTIKQAKREAQVKQAPPPPAMDLFGLIGGVVKLVLPEIVPILTAIGSTANAVNQVQYQRAQHKYNMARLKQGRRRPEPTIRPTRNSLQRPDFEDRVNNYDDNDDDVADDVEEEEDQE